MVAMGIAGLLLSGLVIAIFQTSRVSTRTTTQIAALENVKNAAYWISKDVRMAKTTNLTDGAPAVSNLVLDWTSWYDSSGQLNDIYYRSKYALSSGKLQRSYGSYDPGEQTPSPPIPDSAFSWGATTIAARYISSIEFSQQVPVSGVGKMILVTVTSSPEGRAETAQRKTYHMYLQPKTDPVMP